MANRMEIRRVIRGLVASPADAIMVLDELEDMSHEAVGELTSAWQDPSAGRPWKAISGSVGRCRVALKKRLKKMGAMD